MNKRPVGCEA